MGLTRLVRGRGALELVEPSVEGCNFENAILSGRVNMHLARLYRLSVRQGGAHSDSLLVDIYCWLISLVSVGEHR